MEELVREEQTTVITYTDYGAYKKDLDAELERSAESFIRIGYLLKVARDTGILAASGYANVNEFAQKEYGLDKTQVSRFIRINDRFSEDGYSGSIRKEYRGFGYAKLALMLQIPDSINEELTPDYSKAEIQAVKEEVSREREITDIEVMLEEKDGVQQSLDEMLVKVAYQIGKEDSALYCALWESRMLRDEGVERFTEILAPSGEKAYSVRIPGEGRMMLMVRESRDRVALVSIREGSEKRAYTKAEVMDAFGKIFFDGSAKGSWEKTYGMPYPEEKEEVAPVQPAKEGRVVKAKTPPQPEKKKRPQEQQPRQMQIHDMEKEIPERNPAPEEETDSRAGDQETEKESRMQIPGQDSIENHAEYMPDDALEQMQKRAGEIIEMSMAVSVDMWKGKKMPLDVIRKNRENAGVVKELFEKMEKLAVAGGGNA